MPYMEMIHKIDPAKVIFDRVGAKKGTVPGFTLYGNRVLVGIYERPEKTKSNIIIPDQTREEDRHQGKAGIVLMRGPTAFVSDENYSFGEQTAEVGDWVMLFITDGRGCVVNGQRCRIVRDQDIAMKIPSPDSVF